MRFTKPNPLIKYFLFFLSTSVFVLTLLAAEPHVAYAPTDENQLPDAVLGRAGPLQGQILAYFEDHPKTLGYLARPATKQTQGAVILIHEWNGLSERVKQVADAFAAEGYLTLAADLYSGRTGSNRDENMLLVNETLADTATLIKNLDAAASYLKAQGNTTGKVAAIGWCYGGGVALSYALGSKNHEATAIFYGSLLADPDKMAHIQHEIYGTFAASDTGIPVDQVNAFVLALRKANISNDIHIYDEVKHGFWLHVDRDPDTNMVPALDAWQRLKTYLDRAIN
ncbi:MAG: dienelactone hydrolase family protein [Pseudomonadales bacterium]|nr:dienelactone hydrolase family protein [Pseudomonadales bacterium]